MSYLFSRKSICFECWMELITGQQISVSISSWISLGKVIVSAQILLCLGSQMCYSKVIHNILSSLKPTSTEGTQLFKEILFLFYICGCLRVCVCVCEPPGVAECVQRLRRLEEDSPLEPQSKVVVRLHVGAGNQTWSLCQSRLLSCKSSKSS